MFVPQKLTFPRLIVPAWPKPQSSDTLDSYCERLADIVRSDTDVIIGGASFGGIIALQSVGGVAEGAQKLTRRKKVVPVGPATLSEQAISFVSIFWNRTRWDKSIMLPSFKTFH